MPTIVLAEFYVQAAKRIGRSAAEIRFREMLDSGLSVVDPNPRVSERTGFLRHKYQEKIPCGDCIIGATALVANVGLVVTEDPHFRHIKEIKCFA